MFILATNLIICICHFCVIGNYISLLEKQNYHLIAK